MLAEPYSAESAVDFDAYEAISIHSPSFIMPVFFIAVFWFSLDFVGVTTFFEIDENQHVTKTKKYVVDAFRG